MSNPFLDLTPDERRIHDLLTRLVGYGAADFFKDACDVMAGRAVVSSATHTVAHYLREVESALRDVLLPVGWRVPKGAKAQGHKAEIEAALASLSIPPEDPIAAIWLRLQEEQQLPMRAHRFKLAKPRPIDDAFERFWNDMLAVLLIVLLEFEKRFGELIKPKVDEVVAMGPSSQSVDMLRDKVPNNRIALWYFFEQLDGPDWIQLLVDGGLFDAPPDIEWVDESSYRFAVWPQSEYLVRMAACAPEDVVRAVARVPATDNFGIQHDVRSIAEIVPAEYTTQMLPSLLRMLPHAPDGLAWVSFRTVVWKLRDEGYRAEAVELAVAAIEADDVYSVGDDELTDVLDLLAKLGGLSPDLTARAAELVEDLTSRIRTRTVGGGDNSSPVATEQILHMDLVDVVGLVRVWRPEDGSARASQEGLADTLSMAARQQPERYSRDARAFSTADSIYVTGVVRGLEYALRDGAALDWDGILGLMDELAEAWQSVAIVEDDHIWLGPGFRLRELQLETLRLLDGALRTDQFNPPLDLQERLFSVIARWLQLEDSARSMLPGEKRDPATDSLNGAAGVAVHVLFAYARWVGRSSQGGELTEPVLPSEVLETLADLLETDMSISARAAVGMNLDYAIAADRAWVANHLTSLFPEADSVAAAATWKAFIQRPTFRFAYFDFLDDQYRWALDRLGEADFEDRFEANYRNRLAEHMVLPIVWGMVDPASDTTLAHAFFNSAPPEAVAHAMYFAGRALYDARLLPSESSGVGSEAIRRFVALWDRFAKEGAKNERIVRSLESYGLYFASGLFDEAWSLLTLDEVLEVTSDIDRPDLVLDRLLELVEAHASMVIQCLEQFLSTPEQSIVFSSPVAKEIIVAALYTDEARESASALVGRLLARGYHKYADVGA